MVSEEVPLLTWEGKEHIAPGRLHESDLKFCSRGRIRKVSFPSAQHSEGLGGSHGTRCCLGSCLMPTESPRAEPTCVGWREARQGGAVEAGEQHGRNALERRICRGKVKSLERGVVEHPLLLSCQSEDLIGLFNPVQLLLSHQLTYSGRVKVFLIGIHWGWGNLVGKGQGCRLTSCSSQDSPTKNDPTSESGMPGLRDPGLDFGSSVCLGTSNISITWAPVRNAESQAPPRPAESEPAW